MCGCYSVINPSSTVCVSITDPGMTLMHRDQTVWGLVATYDVSNIAREETSIVSSYILGDFDPSHPLHDPNNYVHNMLPMNHNDIVVPYTCPFNLCPHRVIHNNYSFMMDDMFLYHASNFFERCLSCTNSHVHIHIMMDDVYIYHTHTISLVCVSFV